MCEHSFMLKVVQVGEPQAGMRIDKPPRAIKYWNSVIRQQNWFDENKESLVALLLNTKCDIQGYSLVSVGSLNESLAPPREIFRAAIAFGACSVIVAHNHPSGDVSPSTTDRALFDRLNEAGDLLQIRVLDHIIVGRKRDYYSFREESDAIEEKRERWRRKLRLAARRRARKKKMDPLAIGGTNVQLEKLVVILGKDGTVENYTMNESHPDVKMGGD